MRGPQVQDRGRNQPNLVNTHDKGKLLLEDNKREKQNLVFEQRPVSISGPTTLGGREVGSQFINEEFEFGETNTAKKRRRSSLKIHSNWYKHAYGKKRELRHPNCIGGGLTVEVNGEGIRRVAWYSNKGGLGNSIWVDSSQKEHVVGPSSGSRVDQNSMVNKGVLRRSKWVTKSQREHSRVQNLSVVGSDQECNTQVGLLYPKPTGPTTLVVGESPYSSTQEPLNHDAQAFALSITPHELVAAHNGISSHTDESSASPTPLAKAGTVSFFNGFHAEGPPATLEKVGCLPETSMEAECLSSEGFRTDEPLISLGKAKIEGATRSHAVELLASPAPLEKASTESSFNGFRAEGSPATLEKVGCLPETLAKAGCLFF